jgi:myxalamid-type polyketide synthase MxaE and MxaD
LHLRHWRQLAPAAAGLPFFAELLLDQGAENQARHASAKLRAALEAAEPGMRRAMLEEHLSQQIAQVLRTSASRITPDTPFNTLGMDSLMGLELRNRLESSLGVSLPATMVWSHPTIAALVPHLAAKVGVSLEDFPVAPSQPAEEAATVDELSDGDAAALLTAKLAALDDEYLS